MGKGAGEIWELSRRMELTSCSIEELHKQHTIEVSETNITLLFSRPTKYTP